MQTTVCLVIFILTLIGFAVSGKKVSITVVAMAGAAALVLTGCITAKEAAACFGNTSVMLMASIFVVGAGLNRTQMIKKISAWIARTSKGSFTKVLAGYVILTFILSQFIPSAVACFAIVVPMALGVCREMKINPSKMMMSLGITAIGGVITLPLSSAISEMARINGFLASYEYTSYNMTIFDITRAKLPTAIVIMLLAIFVIPRHVPDKAPAENSAVSVAQKEQKPLGPVQEVIGYATFICVLAGLMFSTQLGVANWVITMIGAIVIAASGILNKKETIEAMNLSMVILYIGCLIIASALSATGAADVIGNNLSNVIINTNNNYLAGFLFFLAPFILTQFMLNLGIYSIFVPLYIMVCKTMGTNPIGPIMLCMMGSMTAFLTPLATPAVPLMMSVGNYDQRDLIKAGWLPAVIIAVVSVFWTMTIYPIF